MEGSTGDTERAMSEENVELVRGTYEAAYEAGGQADYDAVVSYFHPEIEFHAYPRSPEVGVYHGKQALREYLENAWEHYERGRIEVEELLDAGDQVVAVITLHAVPKRGQNEITVHIVEVFTIRDALLAERRSYSTRSEALEAAGLSE
jgi:ketosteroid isomerase-like protein